MRPSLHHVENECQRSWSYILGNLGGDRLQIVIMYWRHVTRRLVSTTVYRSLLRHLDLYWISYHSIVHLYSRAVVCHRIIISYVCGQTQVYVPLHINDILAAYIENRDSETLPALSWLWASTERVNDCWAWIMVSHSAMWPYLSIDIIFTVHVC